MTAGKIRTAHAFEVSPTQTKNFIGGRLNFPAILQSALDATFQASGIARAPAVNFRVDASTANRAHPIRDAALLLAFSASALDADAAATDLAARFGTSMDNRSKAALLMLSTHDLPGSTDVRVLLWTFPRQEVFTLAAPGGRPEIDLLDAFSRESRLRKAAMIDGDNSATGMLSARVLDFQSNASDRAFADLWIEKFLDAALQMSAHEGTRLLARSLRTLHEKTKNDLGAQAQVTAAITMLRNSTSSRHSIDAVGKAQFTPPVRDMFLAGLSQEERSAQFALDRDLFDAQVRYRLFRLDTGVVVSSPFDTGQVDGLTVKQSDGRRTLTATGTVEEESVRIRI